MGERSKHICHSLDHVKGKYRAVLQKEISHHLVSFTSLIVCFVCKRYRKELKKNRERLLGGGGASGGSRGSSKERRKKKKKEVGSVKCNLIGSS